MYSISLIIKVDLGMNQARSVEFNSRSMFRIVGEVLPRKFHFEELLGDVLYLCRAYLRMESVMSESSSLVPAWEPLAHTASLHCLQRHGYHLYQE